MTSFSHGYLVGNNGICLTETIKIIKTLQEKRPYLYLVPIQNISYHMFMPQYL